MDVNNDAASKKPKEPLTADGKRHSPEMLYNERTPQAPNAAGVNTGLFRKKSLYDELSDENQNSIIGGAAEMNPPVYNNIIGSKSNNSDFVLAGEKQKMNSEQQQNVTADIDEFKRTEKMLKKIKKEIAIQKSRIFPVITLLVFIAIIVANSFINKNIGEVSNKYQTLMTPPDGVFVVWFVLYAGLAIVFIWQLVSGSFFFNTIHTIIFNSLHWVSLTLNPVWIAVFTSLGMKSIKRYDVNDRIYYSSDYINRYIEASPQERLDLAPLAQFLIMIALLGLTTAQYHYMMTYTHNALIKFLYGLYFGWLCVASALSFMIFIKYTFWKFMDDQAHIGLYVMTVSLFTLVCVFMSFLYMDPAVTVIGIVYLSALYVKLKETGGFLSMRDVTIVMLVFVVVTCFFVLFYNIQSFIGGLKTFRNDESDSNSKSELKDNDGKKNDNNESQQGTKPQQPTYDEIMTSLYGKAPGTNSRLSEYVNVNKNEGIKE